ncbi:hypothetical protein B0H14DRAFT_2577091 [Mycena olivaceomarginata]|nr:hypothetical protein B0H14DRAFT_2577091 [Mycena olivaceomarginata]
MSAPPPPSHNPRIEHILLQTVPWDARQKGGSLLQDCLRNLWEKAVTIGFNYGEENLARVREEGFCEGKIAGFIEGVESEHSKTVLESTEAAALHEKALEAERVWGYDVRWKLCSELQGGVQEAGTALSATPSPFVTDPVAVLPLDWAEDAGFFPYFLHLYTIRRRFRSPRDFSALSTGAQSHLPAFNVAVAAPLACIPHPSHVHHALLLPDNSTRVYIQQPHSTCNIHGAPRLPYSVLFCQHRPDDFLCSSIGIVIPTYVI